jgi:hypothetical protein
MVWVSSQNLCVRQKTGVNLSSRIRTKQEENVSPEYTLL